MVNRINPKEAPQGYVARRPKGFADTENTIGLCTGCYFMYSNRKCTEMVGLNEPFCRAVERKDKREVIFVKKI